MHRIFFQIIFLRRYSILNEYVFFLNNRNTLLAGSKNRFYFSLSQGFESFNYLSSQYLLESQTGVWPTISFVRAISNELDNPILTVISTKLSPISRYQTTYEYSCLYIAVPLSVCAHVCLITTISGPLI